MKETEINDNNKNDFLNSIEEQKEWEHVLKSNKKDDPSNHGMNTKCEKELYEKYLI